MGSPAWHATKLTDLLTMVDRFGLPSFFVTLTADEVSSMRWREYDDLEEFLHRFNTSFDWKDAPVEGNHLFMTRTRLFMKEFILHKTDGILGTVTHHMLRVEYQSRGSPRIHLVIWVNDVDTERVTKELLEHVPASYDPRKGEFTFVELD